MDDLPESPKFCNKYRMLITKESATILFYFADDKTDPILLSAITLDASLARLMLDSLLEKMGEPPSKSRI